MSQTWSALRSSALGKTGASAGGDRDAIQRGLAHAKDLRALSEKALGLLDGATAPPLDAEAHGALAALLLGRLRNDLVAFWLELGGPGFATACAVHERRLLATHPRTSAGVDLKTRWLEPRTDQQTVVALDRPTWETLGTAFRRVRKAERDAEHAKVRAARAGVVHALACWADGIALLAGEAAEDARVAAALDDAGWNDLEPYLLGLFPALASAPSPATREAALGLLERVPGDAMNRVAPYAKTIVDLCEDECAGALVGLLDAAHRLQGADPTSAKKIAQALATLDDELTAAFFARSVESRLVSTVAAAYVTARRDRASTKVAERAAVIHERATAETAVRSKRAKTAARKVAAKRRRVAIATDAPEARAEELPWLLRAPPWRDPSSVPPLPATPNAKRTPLAFEDRLHLSESDREGIDENTPIDDDDALGLLASKGLGVVPTLLARGDDVTFQALRRVESPRVARWMLRARPGRQATIARRYFADYPEASAIALVELVLSHEDATAERRAVLEALGALVAGGHEQALRGAAAAYLEKDEDAAEIDSLVSAARLLSELAPTASSTAVPSFAAPTKLPPILLATGARLPPSAVEHLLELASFAGTSSRPIAAAREVADVLDRPSLDVFLVALVEAGRKKGGDAEWALRAAALLAGADAARAIGKWIKEWNADRSTRPLAMTAIEALGAGDIAAVSVLAGLGQRGVRGAAGDRAQEVLRAVARREGLSAEELAEVSLPSLDLDEHCRARLEFGERWFEVSLGDDLAPRIVDHDGHVVQTVRALKTDDPTKAQVSLERLRSLKKGLAEVARTAAQRLEQAMTASRTWRVGLWRSTIAAHPILGRLARRLLWARLDLKMRKVAEVLRVAEDGTFATLDDDAANVGHADTVRLVHPLDLDAERTRAWGQVLGDYEIIQPFPQVSRSVFAPTNAEREANVVSRYQGLPAMQMAIAGRLTARGWERINDGGVTSAYVRRLGAVTARYTLVDPIENGEPFVNETTLGTVSFGIPLAKVPEVAFSEIVYDLHVLAEK
jgi:Domain of unknown function (DUF4132)